MLPAGDSWVVAARAHQYCPDGPSPPGRPSIASLLPTLYPAKHLDLFRTMIAALRLHALKVGQDQGGPGRQQLAGLQAPRTDQWPERTLPRSLTHDRCRPTHSYAFTPDRAPALTPDTHRDLNRTKTAPRPRKMSRLLSFANLDPKGCPVTQGDQDR
ncbi:hypothetical protein ACTIVE_1769 [Actinomadura verrucosospora]|uniref:Uncharacterized protein n=1 Tax=Actinomadura verrucosospora TaxID=46165 RepID=A0A7D3VQY0_ACTVE|nr:hypothetical protein ACTIVE_1769 [Actinomadura verrucosospora]